MTAELGHVHITDGVDLVNFHPGVTARRRLIKREGLTIIHVPTKSTPTFITFKSADDMWEIQTTMLNRVEDYETFFNMVKEETNSSSFVLTVSLKTYIVVCLEAIMEIDSGDGDLRTILGTFEVVRLS